MNSSRSIYWQVTKYLLTVFIMILVPVYAYNYGWQNFMWLSDVGLFLTLIALWLDSVLIMSMAAVGLLVLELIWWVDFFMDLLFNINPIALSDYMFNPSIPIALRIMSLFHIITPIIWVSYIFQFGYHKKAVCYFTPVYWLVLLATYLFTNPEYNINWVSLPLVYGMNVPVAIWPFVLAIGFPVLVFLPTHFVYCRLFKTLDN
jgi:hypothetical protein